MHSHSLYILAVLSALVVASNGEIFNRTIDVDGAGLFQVYIPNTPLRQGVHSSKVQLTSLVENGVELSLSTIHSSVDQSTLKFTGYMDTQTVDLSNLHPYMSSSTGKNATISMHFKVPGGLRSTGLAIEVRKPSEFDVCEVFANGDVKTFERDHGLKLIKGGFFGNDKTTTLVNSKSLIVSVSKTRRGHAKKIVVVQPRANGSQKKIIFSEYGSETVDIKNCLSAIKPGNDIKVDETFTESCLQVSPKTRSDSKGTSDIFTLYLDNGGIIELQRRKSVFFIKSHWTLRYTASPQGLSDIESCMCSNNEDDSKKRNSLVPMSTE